jgi:hypothetical protein
MDTQWKIGAAVLTAVIAATGAVVACSSDPTAPQSTMYVARMSGANEVPPVVVSSQETTDGLPKTMGPL